MSQEDILSIIDDAFRDVPRPEHFTNYKHCGECAEHDDLLRSRDRATLTIQDLGSAGWNPIAFLTAEGFVYYFPALAKLALSINGESFLASFVPFHLYEALAVEENGSPDNWLSALSKEQCNAILSFVRFVADQKRSVLELRAVDPEELDQVVTFWKKECSSK